MQEKYQPSKEEIEKAESSMTKKQEIMSDERERDFKSLTQKMIKDLEDGKFNLLRYREKEGKRIDFSSSDDTSPFPDPSIEPFEIQGIKGEIGDEKVDIKVDIPFPRQINPDPTRTFSGTINGNKITDEYDIKRIFDKYSAVARLTDNNHLGFWGVGKHKGVYEKRAEEKIKENEKWNYVSPKERKTNESVEKILDKNE